MIKHFKKNKYTIFLSFWLAFAITVCFIRFGHAQIFDGGPITKAEQHWFDEVSGCCGAADAFVSDYYETKDGKIIATVTDGYDRFYKEQTALKIGTKFVIPQEAIDRSPKLPPNPTGHGVIFLVTSPIFDKDGNMSISFRGPKPNGDYGDVPPEQARVYCYFFPAGN